MALVAWDNICKSKQQGGLGILDICEHNKTLLLKNVHKFYNKEDLPWVILIWEVCYSSSQHPDKKEGLFWWKILLSLIPTYKQATPFMVRSGTTIQLWEDNWNHGPLSHSFPELLSSAKDERISIMDFCGEAGPERSLLLTSPYSSS